MIRLFFVRYAVAESAAYLGVCEHLRRSKVQKEPIRTIFPN